MDSYTGTAAALGCAAVLFASSGCFWGGAAPGPPPPPATTTAPAPAVAPPPPVTEPADPPDEEPPVGEPAEPEGSTSSPGDYVPYEPEWNSDYQKFQDYKQDTGYPYSYEEYDQLPGYQQCGTACGKEPTSGEVQQQWLCEQGITTEGC